MSPWPWTVAERFVFGKILGVVTISIRETGCVYACRVGRKPIDVKARQDVPSPRWYESDCVDVKQALEAMEYWIENDKKTPRVFSE